MLIEGHWGIWRDNAGKRFLVCDHVPEENCWKYDVSKRFGFALWEVAVDAARIKRRIPCNHEFRIFCRSNRIESVNREV